MTDKQTKALRDMLVQVMDLDAPLNFDASYQQQLDYWRYEETQGRGEAPVRIAALELLIETDDLK